MATQFPAKNMWHPFFYLLDSLGDCEMITINPLLSPMEGLIYFKPIWEGGGGGLFNLETIMVSVLHKELEHKVEKHKCKKF